MMSPALMSLILLAFGDSDVRLTDLTFQPREITALVQPAMRGLTLTAKAADSVSKAPHESVTGWVTWPVGPKDGARNLTLAVREAPNDPPSVWVDTNFDGDLTNDPPVAVQVTNAPGGGVQLYRGQFAVRVPKLGDVPLNFKFHRFGPAEAARRKIPADAFFCYPDYGWAGNLVVGGKQYKWLMTDEQATADFAFSPEVPPEAPSVTFFVDANRNGLFEPSERFHGSDTIGVEDAAVVVESVSADGHDIKLNRAGRNEPRIRAPSVANLEAGGKALAFKAKAVDGGEIKFPEEYKGKLVLLDFWATWCGPCVAEIPNVVKAYEKYHNNGFEVLGVSLDRPGSEKLLVTFANDRKMLWRQIYPGNGVANQWQVSSIPRMYLIDGDTGEILASGGALRGEGLDPAIQAAMKKKFASAKSDKK